MAHPEEEEKPRLDLIRPTQGTDQVTIPGPLNPAQLAGIKQPTQFHGKLTAIRITRNHGLENGSILVANRSLKPGEIIQVVEWPTNRDGQAVRVTADMMPGMLFKQQADRLIQLGYAERYDDPNRIETAVQPTHRSAEQATRPPQRGSQRGAI